MGFRAIALIVILTLALLAAPLLADAQKPGKVPRVGYLSWGFLQVLADAFVQGLRERGYVDGQSIAIEYRHGTKDQLPDLAAELVRLQVEVIVALGSPSALAAKQATSTIPIVITLVARPERRGLVTSLARPGGNVTGVALLFPLAKGLELLKKTIPRVSRVALLMDPTNPAHLSGKNAVDEAAKVLGVKVQRVDVRTGADLDGAFAAALRQRAEAFFVFPLRIPLPDFQRIVEFAVKNRVATLMPLKELVEAGGLMSYTPNFADEVRRTGIYIDKILKGAKPSDLPVERATTFELVINLKTARTLDLTIPPSVFILADKVIE